MNAKKYLCHVISINFNSGSKRCISELVGFLDVVNMVSSGAVSITCDEF
jgi:hypothetical protein